MMIGRRPQRKELSVVAGAFLTGALELIRLWFAPPDEPILRVMIEVIAMVGLGAAGGWIFDALRESNSLLSESVRLLDDANWNLAYMNGAHQLWEACPEQHRNLVTLLLRDSIEERASSNCK
jgi:hypothetical protein